jgi:hypothetical protein
MNIRRKLRMKLRRQPRMRLRREPGVNHPAFGTIVWREDSGRWEGWVQVDAFTGYDDVASLEFAEEVGGNYESQAGNSFHREGLFELWVIREEKGEPSPEQAAAFLRFLEHQPPTCDAVVRAIFDDYQSCRDSFLVGKEPHDRILLPELPSQDGLRRLIRLQGLHVLEQAKDGHALLGFCFACSWDVEHGLGALVHGERVVEVGDNSLTRNGPTRRW